MKQKPSFQSGQHIGHGDFFRPPSDVAGGHQPLNGLTIDLEDWFHGLELPVCDWGRHAERIDVCLPILLDLLAATEVRATFFVLGALAEKHPGLIRQLARDGHEIGTHGFAHQFVYRQSPAEFFADLRRSQEIIEAVISQPVRSYRAPYFSITGHSRWALEILAEAGIENDSSLFPVVNYRYGVPDAPRTIYRIPLAARDLIEFPPSTLRLFGVNVPVCGGAYFRIFPYWFTRLGLRHINAAGQAAVFYLHPWELDPRLPRIRLPRRLALTRYWNLAATRKKFSRLLRDFRFTTLKHLRATLQPAAHPACNADGYPSLHGALSHARAA